MSANATILGTPYYVLMNADGRIGPKVVQSDTGIGCTPIYGFSGKSAYEKFCRNSGLTQKPYPLLKGYLRNRIESPGNGLKLVVLDAVGLSEPYLQAATMEAVLEAQASPTTDVKADYRLMLNPESDAYTVEQLRDETLSVRGQE
jgi:hypothetical protein